MKKIIFNIMTISVVTLLTCAVLSGCNRGSNDDPTHEGTTSSMDLVTGNVSETDTAKTLKTDIEGQKAMAEQDVAKSNGVTEAKINQAVEYIEKNLNDSTNAISPDTLKNLAYYGAYLSALGKSKSELANNDLVKYGEKVYDYVLSIYTNTDKIGSDTSKNAMKEIMKLRDNMKASKDKIVSEIYSVFNKK